MVNHFFVGFEKVSKPRWAKMLASGVLSGESIQRIRPAIDKAREIKHLGTGSSQIADLVFHPKHGLVVRKTPLLELTAQKEKMRKIKKALQQQKATRQAEKVVPEHIARLVGTKGPISYQEYVPPTKGDHNSRFSLLLDRINDLTSTHTGSRQYRHSVERVNRLARKDVDQTNLVKNTGVRDAVKQVREAIPGSWDFSPRNVVGDKIIDFEPSKKSYSYKGIWRQGSKPPIKKEDYSKRVFFGKKAFLLGFEKAAALREDTELQPHQQRVVEKMKRSPGMLLYHGLGSGKTLSAIAATQGMKTDVIVPAALRQNFAKEVTKHTTDYDPNVMSYEKSLKTPRGGDALIVDEAHMMGDTTTKRTRSLIKKAPLYQKRLLLTGTPIKNKPHEIGSLMSVVRGDKEVPTDEKLFKEKFVGEKVVEPGFWGKMKGVTPGIQQVIKNPDEFRKLVAGHVDYHEPTREHFPSVTHEVVQTPMHEEQLKYYQYILDKAGPLLSYKIKHNLPPNKQESKNLNSFLQGARQVSNTPAALGGKDISPKFDTALSRLKERSSKDQNFRALIYSNYLDAGVNTYSKRLKESAIPHTIFHGGLNDVERKQAVDDYNSGKIKALLISGAGAQGLDLKGTKLIQVMEPHWNDTKLEQAIGRGIRYKSHEHLPAEERHVHVERYQSTVPKSFWDKITFSKQETSTDQYLDMLSKQKQALNDQFLNILKEEGSKT